MADLDLGRVGDVFMLASHGQEAPERALAAVVAEVGRQVADKLEALGKAYGHATVAACADADAAMIRTWTKAPS